MSEREPTLATVPKEPTLAMLANLRAENRRLRTALADVVNYLEFTEDSQSFHARRVAMEALGDE